MCTLLPVNRIFSDKKGDNGIRHVCHYVHISDLLPPTPSPFKTSGSALYVCMHVLISATVIWI